jgi:hypothetical protein
MPYAPADWSWPTCETEPLFFLGQINCAELQGIPAAEKLPPSGLLAFFADHDAVNGGNLYGQEGFAVFHWTDLDRLVPGKPPIELQEVLPLCALAFRPMIDLPYWRSSAIEGLELSGDDDDAYYDLTQEIHDHGIPESSRERINYSKL